MTSFFPLADLIIEDEDVPFQRPFLGGAGFPVFFFPFSGEEGLPFPFLYLWLFECGAVNGFFFFLDLRKNSAELKTPHLLLFPPSTQDYMAKLFPPSPPLSFRVQAIDLNGGFLFPLIQT